MTEAEYKQLVKELAGVHGIASTFGRRRGLEQRYYAYHRARGVRLRGKYRR